MEVMEPVGMDAGGEDESKNWMAYVALGLGIVGLCAGIIPICGFPIGIGGIVLGYMGRSSEQKTLATVGLGLSIFVILIACASGAFGAFTALSDPYFLESFQ